MKLPIGYRIYAETKGEIETFYVTGPNARSRAHDAYWEAVDQDRSAKVWAIAVYEDGDQVGVEFDRNDPAEVIKRI
jgi:hypothetical protein